MASGSRESVFGVQTSTAQEIHQSGREPGVDRAPEGGWRRQRIGGRIGGMNLSSQDASDQFSEASTTPFWDLAIGLITLATVLGGGLAGVFGIGYLAVGREALAWPPLTTVAALVIVNLALRWGRRAARGRY
jgi:hypothetical protein